ncbi:hypothetical protein G7054_g9927 [Neopestalotiopsis clavispora]|nr:hypothetical protein G7054_g9927 [Neopestalotiopsis clavispora]
MPFWEFIGLAGEWTELFSLFGYYTHLVTGAKLALLGFFANAGVMLGLWDYGEKQRAKLDEKKLKEITEKARKEHIIGPHDPLPGYPLPKDERPATAVAALNPNLSPVQPGDPRDEVLAMSIPPPETIVPELEAFRSCKYKCVPTGKFEFPVPEGITQCLIDCIWVCPRYQSHGTDEIDGPVTDETVADKEPTYLSGFLKEARKLLGAKRDASANMTTAAANKCERFIMITNTPTPKPRPTSKTGPVLQEPGVESRNYNPDHHRERIPVPVDMPGILQDNLPPGHAVENPGPSLIDADDGRIGPRELIPAWSPTSVMPTTLSTVTFSIQTISPTPSLGLPLALPSF